MIARVLAAAVLLAGAGLAAAGPASAADPLTGLYTYQAAGQPDETWTIFPTCVPAGCVLHISTGAIEQGHHGGDARPVNDQWMWGYVDTEGLSCPDGSQGSVTYSYAFDDKTLTGTKTAMHPQFCGQASAMTKQPFTLAYQRPLDAPLEQYPYMCPTWPNCNYNTVVPGINGYDAGSG